MKLNFDLIDTLRTKKGWSRAELARQSGVTPAAISRIFSSKGKRSPTLETVGGIAKALGVEIMAIIVDEEEEPETCAA